MIWPRPPPLHCCRASCRLYALARQTWGNGAFGYGRGGSELAWPNGPALSRQLYVEALGLPVDHAEGDEYYHSEQIAGSKHFGVWPLRQAARACFGVDDWPAEHRVPQASVEFELNDAEAVSAAAQELQDKGFSLLHPARKEPWGKRSPGYSRPRAW
jgi:catechol 2,3-dioxygenase-like lactoylglutathione lyase family enzyme